MQFWKSTEKKEYRKIFLMTKIEAFEENISQIYINFFCKIWFLT